VRYLSTIISFSSLITLTGSCILPYEIDNIAYDQVIVVDGVLSTENKRHTIHLSYTLPLSSFEQPALERAQVWVERSDGQSIDFIEQGQGSYQSTIEFAADDRYDYQLFFRTSEGKLYQSTRERPIPSPPIDSIYDRYAELIPVNTTTQDYGIQFFLDSHDESGKAQHFRYEWEETYKIVTPYISAFVYSSEQNKIINREVPISICYSTNTSSSLILGTTAGSSENRIVELPVQFVSGNSDLLRNRYSILVRQYAISSSTYSYYQRLKDSERQGTLFDEQQGTITGNISSITDPEEIVLGNFEVAGVSSLRTFFSFSELDEKLAFPEFRFRCITDDLIGTSLNGALDYLESNKYNIISYGAMPEVTLAKSLCSDCSYYATNVEPDFWIDE
jgi:hypothetical protein